MQGEKSEASMVAACLCMLMRLPRQSDESRDRYFIPADRFMSVRRLVKSGRVSSCSSNTIPIMAQPKSSKKASKHAAQTAPAKDAQIDSPFLHVNTDIRLSIPPVFATDLHRGAMEMLDSLVMR